MLRQTEHASYKWSRHCRKSNQLPLGKSQNSISIISIISVYEDTTDTTDWGQTLTHTFSDIHKMISPRHWEREHVGVRSSRDKCLSGEQGIVCIAVVINFVFLKSMCKWEQKQWRSKHGALRNTKHNNNSNDCLSWRWVMKRFSLSPVGGAAQSSRQESFGLCSLRVCFHLTS